MIIQEAVIKQLELRVGDSFYASGIAGICNKPGDYWFAVGYNKYAPGKGEDDWWLSSPKKHTLSIGTFSGLDTSSVAVRDDTPLGLKDVAVFCLDETGEIRTDITPLVKQDAITVVVTVVTRFLTLRPNAAGDYTNIARQYPYSGEHWDKVDEAIADEDKTRIYTSSTSQQKDAYKLQSADIPSGSTINSVTVYFRIKAGYVGKGQPFLRLGTSETAGTEITEPTGIYHTYSQILARPGGGSWSLSDLNSLQVVIGLKSGTTRYYFYCTQVYVEVKYTAFIVAIRG